MKKGIIFVLVTLFILIFPMFEVHADMGPKRTLDIEIVGVSEPYRVELLVKGTLPVDEQLIEVQNRIGDMDPDFPLMLYSFESYGYIAANLIYGYGLYYQQPQDNYFVYGYNPPSQFKIMLIFDDDHYVISRATTTTLFNSKVTYDLTGIDTSINQFHVGKITEVFPVETMVLDLSLRIIGTIIIEILVLFLFGYVNKQSYKLIIFTNLVTQIGLTGFMFAAKYFFFPIYGELFVLIVGEALIFLAEIILYRFYLTERSKQRAMIYALVANVITLIASYSVMILLINL